MATNFLYAAGTNGYVTGPAAFLSTELSGANGVVSISNIGGSSGVYNQSNTGNAIWASVWFTAGGAFTPTIGGALNIWFARSPEGTNFETISLTSGLPRTADVVIPLQTIAYASGVVSYCQGGLIRLPNENYKVVVQNNSGATLPTTGNSIKFGTAVVQSV